MVSFPFFPIKEAQGYHNNRSEISPNLLHKSGIMRGFSNGSRAFPRDQSYPLERDSSPSLCVIVAKAFL